MGFIRIANAVFAVVIVLDVVRTIAEEIQRHQSKKHFK